MTNTNEWFEQINEGNTKALNAVVSFNELTKKTVEKLAQAQIELANEALNDGVEKIQSLGKVTSLPEFIDGQKALIGEIGSRMVDVTKARVDMLVEAQGEYAKWFEAQFAAVQASVEPVAAKPAPRRPRARKAAVKAAA